MATRKKKSDTMEMPGTIGGAKVVLPKKQKWPKVVSGTHLTVTTYENGDVEMVWDHDALQRECEEAIASVEKK